MITTQQRETVVFSKKVGLFREYDFLDSTK